MTWDRGAGVLPTTHRHMTAEEYFEMPEGPPYFQLIDGELFMSPSPSYFHQKLALRVATAFENFLATNPVGDVQIAPSDVRLDNGNVYQPDVYFILTERLSIIDRQGPRGAPDIVVEVISDSTGRLDLGPKKTMYAESGVQEFWAVFPDRKTIEAFHLPASAEVPVSRLGLQETLTTPLLPGFSLSLASLFR